MSISFTQYLRPNGRKVSVQTDLDPETEAKAHKLIAAGYAFEIEELRTGQVSATIVHPDKDYDCAITVCKNGPDVPVAITKMIKEFKY